MQQQISVVTLGVADPIRARDFYSRGFGWSPVFEQDDIVFYQMNGLMLGLWNAASLREDMQDDHRAGASTFALAHNVPSADDVRQVMERLVAAGGTVLRAPDAPPHGGFRGYVADPDGHPWEIAWNPAWSIDDRGLVTFGV